MVISVLCICTVGTLRDALCVSLPGSAFTMKLVSFKSEHGHHGNGQALQTRAELTESNLRKERGEVLITQMKLHSVLCS